MVKSLSYFATNWQNFTPKEPFRPRNATAKPNICSFCCRHNIFAAVDLKTDEKEMEIKLNNVCAFGDSVMKGIVADRDNSTGRGLKYRISEMGFAERCRRSLNIEVDNFARFGGIVSQGTKLVERYKEKIRNSESFRNFLCTASGCPVRYNRWTSPGFSILRWFQQFDSIGSGAAHKNDGRRNEISGKMVKIIKIWWFFWKKFAIHGVSAFAFFALDI